MLLTGADRNVKENLFPKMYFILYSESGKTKQNKTPLCKPSHTQLYGIYRDL